MFAGIHMGRAPEFSLCHSVTEQLFVKSHNRIGSGDACRAAVERDHAQSGREEKTIGNEGQGKEKGDSANEFGKPNRDAEVRRVDKRRIAAEVFDAEVGERAVQDEWGGEGEKNDTAAAN